MGRFRENSEKEGHIWRARRKMWISRGTIYRENKEGTHREMGKTYGEVEISSRKGTCGEVEISSGKGTCGEV